MRQGHRYSIYQRSRPERSTCPITSASLRSTATPLTSATVVNSPLVTATCPLITHIPEPDCILTWLGKRFLVAAVANLSIQKPRYDIWRARRSPMFGRATHTKKASSNNQQWHIGMVSKLLRVDESLEVNRELICKVRVRHRSRY